MLNRHDLGEQVVKNPLRMMMALIEMARPVDGLIIGGAVILGVVMRQLSFPSWNLAILGTVMGVALLGAMDTLNDIMDVKADTISKPWRPLPSGRVSVRLALAAVVMETATGLYISIILGISVFFLVLLSICLAIAYSLWLKPFFFSKNLVVALTLSLAYLSGAFAVGGFTLSLSAEFWIIYALILLVAFCFEIHKDIADIEGDKATNVHTIPTVLGEKVAVVLSSLGYVSAWIISAVVITLNGITIIQVLLLVITALMGLMIVWLLWRNPLKHVELTRRIATMLIGLMIIAFVDNQIMFLSA